MPKFAFIFAFTYFEFSDIVIAALDATTASSIAAKYGVTGYPTIKYFPKGSTTPEDYKGGRTADTIVRCTSKSRFLTTNNI